MEDEMLPELFQIFKGIKTILNNTALICNQHVDQINNLVTRYMAETSNEVHDVINLWKAILPATKYSRRYICFDECVLSRKQVQDILTTIFEELKKRNKYDDVRLIFVKLEVALVIYGDSLENALYFAGMTSEDEFKEFWEMFRTQAEIIIKNEDKTEAKQKAEAEVSSTFKKLTKLKRSKSILMHNKALAEKGVLFPPAVVPSEERRQKYFQEISDHEAQMTNLKNKSLKGIEVMTIVIKENLRIIQGLTDRKVLEILSIADTVVDMITEIMTHTVEDLKGRYALDCGELLDFVFYIIMKQVNEVRKFTVTLKYSDNPDETFIGRAIQVMNNLLYNLEDIVDMNLKNISKKIQNKLKQYHDMEQAAAAVDESSNNLGVPLKCEDSSSTKGHDSPRKSNLKCGINFAELTGCFADLNSNSEMSRSRDTSPSNVRNSPIFTAPEPLDNSYLFAPLRGFEGNSESSSISKLIESLKCRKCSRSIGEHDLESSLNCGASNQSNRHNSQRHPDSEEFVHTFMLESLGGFKNNSETLSTSKEESPKLLESLKCEDSSRSIGEHDSSRKSDLKEEINLADLSECLDDLNSNPGRLSNSKNNSPKYETNKEHDHTRNSDFEEKSELLGGMDSNPDTFSNSKDSPKISRLSMHSGHFASSVEDSNGNSASVSNSENKRPKNIESSLNGGHTSRSNRQDSSLNPHLEGDVNIDDLTEALDGVISNRTVSNSNDNSPQYSESSEENGDPRNSEFEEVFKFEDESELMGGLDCVPDTFSNSQYKNPKNLELSVHSSLLSGSIGNVNGNSGSLSNSENKSPKNTELSLNGGHTSCSNTHDSSRNPNLEEEINNTDMSKALDDLNRNSETVSNSKDNIPKNHELSEEHSHAKNSELEIVFKFEDKSELLGGLDSIPGTFSNSKDNSTKNLELPMHSGHFSTSMEDLNGNSGSVSKSKNKSPKNIESLNGGHVSRSDTHDSSRNPNLEEINNTDFCEAMGNLNINLGILSPSSILKLPIEQLKRLKLSTSARKTEQPRASDHDLANEVIVIQLSELFGIRDFREVIMENISGFRSDLSIAYYVLNSKFGAHQRLLTETCDGIKNGISSLLYTLEVILERAMIIFSRMVVECDIVTLTDFKAELMKDINDAK